MKSKAAAKKSTAAPKPYKVEKGMRMPEEGEFGGGVGQPSRVGATLAVMEKGESFLLRDELEALKASKIMRDKGRRDKAAGRTLEFAMRRVKNGWRIWRVA